MSTPQQSAELKQEIERLLYPPEVESVLPRLIAIVERVSRNAVMDYMDLVTKKDGRSSFNKAELDALDEMFP